MERRGRPGGILLGLVLLLAAGLPFAAQAQSTNSVSVTASVPAAPPFPTYPVVQLNGGVSPFADITVTRDSSPLIVPDADGTGLFAITLSEQPVGEHTYVISAIDGDGRAHAPITIIIDLQYSTTTTIDNLILGPSIVATDPTVDENGTVGAIGRTIADASVEVSFISTSTFPQTVTANGSGEWSASFPASTFAVGTVTIRATATYNFVTSIPSADVTVTISAIPPPTNTNQNTNTNTNQNTNSNQNSNLNTNTPTNTNRPTTTNRPGPQPTYTGGDINQDRRVNVVDFSIMMYYWNARNPANARTDINRDGRVDMVDFSIMLFQWTG